MSGELNYQDNMKNNYHPPELLNNSSNKSSASNLLISKVSSINEAGYLFIILVSTLTNIVIQSLKKGNSTLYQQANTAKEDSDINTPVIVSGNWIMEVTNSNVTNVNMKFLMMSLDAYRYHWYPLENFNTNKVIPIGFDGTIVFKGCLNFYIKSSRTITNGNACLSI
jgi:hypothetical protein